MSKLNLFCFPSFLRLFFPVLVFVGTTYLFSVSTIHAAQPNISDVAPLQGSVDGGTALSITGTNYENITEEFLLNAEVTDGYAFSQAVTTDGDGSVYVTGFFTEDITIGSLSASASGGGIDVFVVKYDASGNEIWLKTGGGTQRDYGRSITIDADGNVYVAGTFEGTANFGALSASVSGSFDDVFVVKYDASGNEIWLRTGENLDQSAYASSIKSDANGDVYLTGRFNGTIEFGLLSATSAGSGDVFVIKYDTTGSEQWLRTGANLSSAAGTSLALDADGNVYVTGDFRGTITFGSFTLVNPSGDDVFLVKYNSEGTEQWVRSGSNAGYAEEAHVTTDSSGHIYLTGVYVGTIIFGSLEMTSDYDAPFLVKYNSDGTEQWIRGTGSGSFYSYPQSISTDPEGNIYISGYFDEGTIDFFGEESTEFLEADGLGAFIVKYNAAGSPQWLRVNTSAYYTEGNSIAADTEGNIYLAGYVETAVTLGTLTASPNGNSYFLAKFIEEQTQISVGENMCVLVNFVSPTVLTCETPSGSAGYVDVTVINPSGEFDTLTSGFLYLAPSPSPSPSSESSSLPSPLPEPQTQGFPNNMEFSPTSSPVTPICTEPSPVGQPDLFQITRTATSATLYFTPVNDNIEKYHLVYGFQEGDERFGSLSHSVTRETNNGVQSLTVRDLDPQSSYWFKVVPVNGCAVGSWSNWLEVNKAQRFSILSFRYI